MKSIYNPVAQALMRMNKLQFASTYSIVYLPIFGDTAVNATIFAHIQLRFLVSETGNVKFINQPSRNRSTTHELFKLVSYKENEEICMIRNPFHIKDSASL